MATVLPVRSLMPGPVPACRRRVHGSRVSHLLVVCEAEPAVVDGARFSRFHRPAPPTSQRLGHGDIGEPHGDDLAVATPTARTSPVPLGPAPRRGAQVVATVDLACSARRSAASADVLAHPDGRCGPASTAMVIAGGHVPVASQVELLPIAPPNCRPSAARPAARGSSDVRPKYDQQLRPTACPYGTRSSVRVDLARPADELGDLRRRPPGWWSADHAGPGRSPLVRTAIRGPGRVGGRDRAGTMPDTLGLALQHAGVAGVLIGPPRPRGSRRPPTTCSQHDRDARTRRPAFRRVGDRGVWRRTARRPSSPRPRYARSGRGCRSGRAAWSRVAWQLRRSAAAPSLERHRAIAATDRRSSRRRLVITAPSQDGR